MSERLNHVTKVMEDLGLVILKDENGDYVARGNRNIKIMVRISSRYWQMQLRSRTM